MTLNLGVLKTPSGYLKVLHVILGAISLGLVANYFILSFGNDSLSTVVPLVVFRNVFFFIMVAFACLFTSFVLLVSYLVGNTAEKMNKTVFDALYHAFSFVLYLAAAIALRKIISEIPPYATNNGPYGAVVVALMCAVMNAILYATNACIGSRV